MKTVPTKASVATFIAAVEDSQRRRECRSLLAIMRRVTGKKPVLWGDSIVGFDAYSYERANGERHTFFRAGFSPRKAVLTIYSMPGYEGFGPILARLGPHKLGKCCLYLKRLADVDPAVLEELIAAGFADINRRYPPTRARHGRRAVM